MQPLQRRQRRQRIGQFIPPLQQWCFGSFIYLLLLDPRNSLNIKYRMLNKTVLYLLLTAALVAAVFIYRHPPHQSNYYPPCIFKKITGFDCAGCGSARATHHLLHGRVHAAADHNLLLLFLLPVLLIGLVYFFFGRLQKTWLFFNRPLLLLVLILLFWFVRNIPVWPISWLHSDK